jgi:hypothetical protein
MSELDGLIRQSPELVTAKVLNRLSPKITFWGGNKKLDLWILKELEETNTFISNIPGRRSISGMTTRLYERAIEVVQLAADYHGREIVYMFQSKIPTMISWARDPEKGGRVFIWSRIGDTEDEFYGEQVFHPRNQS